MLTIIKPFQKTLHSRTQSPCFESGFVYFESGFSKVQVRVLLNTSPDFFRVRVRSGFRSMPTNFRNIASKDKSYSSTLVVVVLIKVAILRVLVLTGRALICSIKVEEA